ncbi:MAG: electron transfer flavoprotein beta subunit/FixA family protein [Propionibacteriaceae bacterium]|jgi:electron transfer flavoprotein beta subunit|nr:electron transfer flavoprotein beta subunit/FixA family protein [Propionibacteriaceae bacterium]
MKIVVTYQWALDPQEASVGADGSVDFSRAKAAISDYDATAIQAGRDLADATGAALVGVSVGGPAAAQAVATKAGLSRGLDEALVVADPSLQGAGTLATAQVIAAAVKSLGDVSLVITGDASLDSGSKMLAPVLGGVLGWPAFTDAGKIAVAGSAVTAERVLSEGVQTLSAQLPAVVGATSDAAKAKAPGMKDILAAGKKPVTVKTPADLGVALPAEGSVLSKGKLSGPARKQARIDTADPAAAAQELVAALRAAGVLG